MTLMPILPALLAAAMSVLPVTDASRLVTHAAGKEARPVVLHFWASWCSACREEFPVIRQQLTSPPDGVAVLLVSIDRPKDRAKAERTLKRYKLRAVPAVLLDAPEPEPVAQAIGRPDWDGTLPATFVFDADGKLRTSFIGRAPPDALEAAVREVKR